MGDEYQNYSPNCKDIFWSELDSCIQENNLSCLTVNGRSIGNKFSNLLAKLNIAKKRFTFIVITETWLKSDSDFVLEIDGYKSCSIVRPTKRAGGIKLYYLDYISIEVINRFTVIKDSYESLFLKAAIPGIGSIFVGGVYRVLKNTFL